MVVSEGERFFAELALRFFAEFTLRLFTSFRVTTEGFRMTYN